MSAAPFFLLGAARSGTTLLRLVLDRHPRLSIPPESHFLLPLLERFPIDRPLDTAEARLAADLIAGHRRFADWPVDAAKLRAAFSALAPCPLAALVDRVFRLAIAPTGKPRWGDKTPAYTPYWRHLAALFPEARLLHLVRDGRDVAASLERLGWHGRGVYGRARYWRSRAAAAARSLARLGPGRCLVVRYEDLVLETESTVERICGFLGEEPVPEMLCFDGGDRARLSDLDGPVHPEVGRRPRPTDVERWRREGSWWGLLQFEAVAGRALSRAGYRRRFAGLGRWLPAAAAIPCRIVGAALEVTGRHHHETPRYRPLPLERR